MNVDAIYVISLITATERQKLIKSWYPPNANLQFFLVERSQNPEQGCFESHQKVFQLAKSKGYTKILILEDDAFPRYPWDDIVSKTNTALSELSNNKWDILALGYYPLRTKKTNMKDILSISITYGSHAYIANLPNIKIHKWNKITTDQLLFWKKKSPYIAYATHDILFEQKFKKSQINNLSAYEFGLTKFPELFGGLDKMRDLSTNCHVGVFAFFFILTLPLLLLTTIISGSIYGKYAILWCSLATLIISIISLFLLFLL